MENLPTFNRGDSYWNEFAEGANCSKTEGKKRPLCKSFLPLKDDSKIIQVYSAIFMDIIIRFLACLYESTESYCCHFDISVGIGVTL